MTQNAFPAVPQAQSNTRDADPRMRFGVPALLANKGVSEAGIDALMALDVALFQWRRMAERGEFKGKLVESLSEKLDPAILQGLLSVSQISSGLGREAPQAPTIGMVAEVMAVDPSRASRIVSELVSRGFVERRASQEDARKSTLVVSPKGQAFLGEFTRAKWTIMAQVFAGWEAEDIASFSDLFARYVSGLSEAVGLSGSAPR
nr:MarR family transcriptional regulator [uncultured Celeribacter sp.]